MAAAAGGVGGRPATEPQSWQGAFERYRKALVASTHRNRPWGCSGASHAPRAASPWAAGAPPPAGAAGSPPPPPRRPPRGAELTASGAGLGTTRSPPLGAARPLEPGRPGRRPGVPGERLAPPAAPRPPEDSEDPAPAWGGAPSWRPTRKLKSRKKQRNGGGGWRMESGCALGPRLSTRNWRILRHWVTTPSLLEVRRSCTSLHLGDTIDGSFPSGVQGRSGVGVGREL